MKLWTPKLIQTTFPINFNEKNITKKTQRTQSFYTLLTFFDSV